jgi:anti-sigma B factor antagonist
MATAPQLQAPIDELLNQGHKRLIFDLSEVSFCDSTGLSVFVRTKNSCDAVDGDVKLAEPQRGVMRILEVSGLVEVLATYGSVDEALAASAAAPAE